MTKSELMLYAIAEARKMTGLSWREAMRFGLRRAHNKNGKWLFVQAQLAKPALPKFMWLRGM